MSTTRTEQDWLEAIRASVLRGDLSAAQESAARARTEHPESVELRRTQAGIHRQAGRTAEAESLLHALLGQDPGDVAAAFALARLLKEQGRTAAAAVTMRACFAANKNCRDADLVINAIELLDDGDRKADADAIAEAAIAARPDDARLHAYAGMLAIQLGDFERARSHYLLALQHDPRALEWHMAIGLSSTLRYSDPAHPDFALFRTSLQRTGLSDLARAELNFALGKAHDDVGDYARAAQHFRQGNAIRKRFSNWSRKAWRRSIEARLASKPLAARAEPVNGFTPVFIVGMPRTGTTLLAELLSRHPRVSNRGELPWLARLTQQPDMSDLPNRSALQRAASRYAALTRQDDAPDARWFLDKQPLNFRYVDLALAMFPDAKVIHCRRNQCDTALSIWMQCFLEDVQGYAYDFGDMAQVMRDCERLMSHWHERFPESIRTVHYEDLVTDTQTTHAALAQWIGLPTFSSDEDGSGKSSSQISTASLWQARQPVHARSIGRWKHYAAHVPELGRIAQS